jgi:SpoVK/Ycf46/Vps4 family AAA+-type ATPase
LGGLTLKEVGEICQISMAKYQDLSVPNVLAVRRMLVPSLGGISQVDPYSQFYWKYWGLELWAKQNKKFFFDKTVDTRLVPRGILLSGGPGVGKTQGAKYLAREWGLPLYRLDLSGLMSKWLGEAESKLRNALMQVDKEEPCIMLIDEVEKVFSHSTDDSGVVPRMLSQMLWWLQEHTTRVFTVMTTNDVDKIPKEMIRPGRVDALVQIPPLKEEEIKDFAKSLLQTFGSFSTVHWMERHTKHIAANCNLSPVILTPAEITASVLEYVKERL